ncbi:MAG TPA: phosphoethanolamine transferase [Steroidobacteraceae bacterium]|nr:phosphoethanolamine transferase [Steroidobacteraceae bacterium]
MKSSPSPNHPDAKPSMVRSHGGVLAGFAILLAPYLALGAWVARHERAHSLAAYVATVTLLMLLIAFAMQTWRRFFLLNLPLWLLSAAFAAYTITYNNPPGYAIAYVIATSSIEEALGFFTIWQGERILLAAAIAVALYLALALRIAPRPMYSGARTGPIRWGVLGGVLLLSAYAARSSADFMDGIAANPAVGSVLFVTGPLSNVTATLHGAALSKVPYGASRVSSDEVHILIVGESARRDSWSVYGYSRHTTPYLEKLKSSGEAVFFANAIADANLTVYAVPILLTGMNPDSFDLGTLHGNLVDLAKEAGYSTAWLMNQDIGVSLLVGISADRMVYPQALAAFVSKRMPLDGVLLRPLEAQLAHVRGPQFIGLHVIGSHWEYYARYPPQFERFGSGRGLDLLSAFTDKTDRRVVNTYDNSVLYTDWFLEQVIEQVRRLTVPATVTYISDHGEDLYALDGQAGHGTPTYSTHQFEIPAFVWMNAAFRRAHPDKVQAVEQNANKLIRSHNLFYSLADLMGIHWPGASPTESFASPRFVPDRSSKHIAGGQLVAGH